MYTKIVADENIPYVKDAFASLGEVTTVHGRSLTREMLLDAEMLLVRSITKVNAELLEGTPVRFVATATIGEDHIDKAYLETRGIAFASAPGSNADSVADYFTGFLLELAERLALNLDGMSIGIIGVGNVGSRVARRAEALGMRCVLHDPPLARVTRDPKFEAMSHIYACDIVTCHVPLTKEGPDRTHHMVDAPFFAKWKPGGILINTSRGSVVWGDALFAALRSGRIRAAILDVWEGEPRVDRNLLEKVAFGTPHIAGYSFDGKVNGTRMIYEAACRFLGVAPSWDPSPMLPAPECAEVTVDSGLPAQTALLDAVRAVYDFRRDDAAMRSIIPLDADAAAIQFDRLRKEYPVRREFKNTTVRLTRENGELNRRFAGLGFNTEAISK